MSWELIGRGAAPGGGQPDVVQSNVVQGTFPPLQFRPSAYTLNMSAGTNTKLGRVPTR